MLTRTGERWLILGAAVTAILMMAFVAWHIFQPDEEKRFANTVAVAGYHQTGSGSYDRGRLTFWVRPSGIDARRAVAADGLSWDDRPGATILGDGYELVALGTASIPGALCVVEVVRAHIHFWQSDGRQLPADYWQVTPAEARAIASGELDTVVIYVQCD